MYNSMALGWAADTSQDTQQQAQGVWPLRYSSHAGVMAYTHICQTPWQRSAVECAARCEDAT